MYGQYGDGFGYRTGICKHFISYTEYVMAMARILPVLPDYSAYSEVAGMEIFSENFRHGNIHGALLQMADCLIMVRQIGAVTFYPTHLPYEADISHQFATSDFSRDGHRL